MYLDIHELRGANVAQSLVIADMQMGILLIWISNEQTLHKKLVLAIPRILFQADLKKMIICTLLSFDSLLVGSCD